MRPKVFKNPIYVKFQVERDVYEELQKEGTSLGNVSHLFREAIDEKLARVRLVRVKDRTPTNDGCYTVSINNKRFSANYVVKTDIWTDIDRKTYKSVDYWINA